MFVVRPEKFQYYVLLTGKKNLMISEEAENIIFMCTHFIVILKCFTKTKKNLNFSYIFYCSGKMFRILFIQQSTKVLKTDLL